MKFSTVFGLALTGMISAHSWLDCIGDADQQYSGPDQYFSDDFYKHCIGFPRGYPGRMNRHINDLFVVVVENRGGPNHDANVCQKTQSSMNYTTEFPMAKVKAGSNLKLWYELDNHYTPTPTWIYLYGHGKPNSQITKYNEQVESNLLGKYIFATPDNCKDIKNVNSLCWNYWQVPKTWAPGTYSLLFNWHLDKNPVGEEYNTCFELEVVADGSQPDTSSSITAPASTPAPTPIVETSYAPTLPQPSHRPKCKPKH